VYNRAVACFIVYFAFGSKLASGNYNVQCKYSLDQCLSTRVLQVAAGGSTETDGNWLGQNSHPQFYAVVPVPLFQKFIT